MDYEPVMSLKLAAANFIFILCKNDEEFLKDFLNFSK